MLSRVFIVTLTLSAVCIASRSLAEDPAPPKVKVGFAERDITPEVGMEQPGGYGKAFHTNLHDACKVRAAVFDDGTGRVAVVGVDILMVRRDTVETARKAISAKCGIPPEAILIAASHSHSAGPVGVLKGEFDHASKLVQKLAYENTSTVDPKYQAKLDTALVDAVVAADASRAPCRCGVGFGMESKAAHNRRFRMRSGLATTHPGQGNPDIIEAAGPIDPQVGVIGAWNAEGKMIGCIVNFACHATTGPGGISADYICYLEKTIRGAMGDDAVVVFVPGAGGDVTQVDNVTLNQVKQFGEAAARRVGGRVGAEAVKVLSTVEQGDLLPVRTANKMLTIKRRAPRPERVAKALELVDRETPAANPTEWTFAKEILMLDALLAKHPAAEVEVQAIQIGPAILLCCPAEYFCQYGLDIKAGSKFPFTFPVSLANGSIGYVPTEDALGPRGGGYETRLTGYSNLVPTAGRQIADAEIALSKEFSPGAVPAPQPIPPFKAQPFSYGLAPPELD